MKKRKIGDIVIVIGNQSNHYLKDGTKAAIIEVYDYGMSGVTYHVLGQDAIKHETIEQFITEKDIKNETIESVSCL